MTSYLRDINLRWEDDGTAPEWFGVAQVPEYFFYKLVRQSKILSRSFDKLNVYCVSSPDRESIGNTFDGVLDVCVAISPDASSLSATARVKMFTEILACGVKRAMHHAVDASAMANEIAGLAYLRSLNYSIALSRRPLLLKDGRSVKAFVVPGEDLKTAVVRLRIYQGRRVVGEIDACTTFPSPEFSIDAFRTLENSCGKIGVCFQWPFSSKTLFGRCNFDAAGLEGVSMIEEIEKRTRIFQIDIDNMQQFQLH